jgi:hypothetical protein
VSEGLKGVLSDNPSCPRIDKVKDEKRAPGKLKASKPRFVDERRRKIFDVLIKLISDTLMFQMAKPTLNGLWWEVNVIYKNLLGFVKNLAEGNYIEFKEFVATYKFSSQHDTGFNPKKLGMTEFFTCQMLFVVNWSLIAENPDPVLLPTDQSERIMANLHPLISVLTELSTGPCILNQKIILSAPYLPIYPILLRKIDDLTSEFVSLQLDVIGLLLSLCESGDKRILLRIARFIPPIALEENVSRYTKKLFMREMIKTGKVQEKLK